MSESYEHLTDEDLAAIDRILEGSLEQQHGEQLLAMWQSGQERRAEENRALLEAISQATMEQEEGKQE